MEKKEGKSVVFYGRVFVYFLKIIKQSVVYV